MAMRNSNNLGKRRDNADFGAAIREISEGAATESVGRGQGVPGRGGQKFATIGIDNSLCNTMPSYDVIADDSAKYFLSVIY